MDYQMLGAFTAIPKEPHFSSPQIVKLGSTMAFHHNAQLLDPSSGSCHGNAQLLDPITGYRAVQYRTRSEEHTSELQSHHDLVCRLLLEKKKKKERKKKKKKQTNKKQKT